MRRLGSRSRLPPLALVSLIATLSILIDHFATAVDQPASSGPFGMLVQTATFY